MTKTSTIAILTSLSATTAAALGLTRYGTEAVTPTEEQWQALPVQHSGKAIEASVWAQLSGVEDPYQEMARQIGLASERRIDKALIDAAIAAGSGLTRYGTEAVTPTEEQWQALPEQLRVFLASEYLTSALTVKAPGWEAAVAAAVEEYERRVAQAIESKTTHQYGLLAVAEDPRVVEALRAEDERQRQIARQREAERTAELMALPPLEAFERTYQRGDTPELVKTWLDQQWPAVVEAAAQRAIKSGDYSLRIDPIREALRTHPAVLEHEAAVKAKEQRAAEKKAAREAAEKAGLDAWASQQEGEAVRYAREHGYGALELLIDAVDETLERYSVVKLREDSEAYDGCAWEKRKNPKGEAIALAMEVTDKLGEVGLPITSGLEGEQDPDGPHLHILGVCRFEDEDGHKSTRVLVQLSLPASPDVIWAVCRDEYAAE